MHDESNMRCRILLAVVLTFATTRLLRAGATTPTLALSSAAATVVDAGIRSARFEAAYDYSNAVQADYDLELIVFQGENFARYPVSGPARVGSSTALADGLTAGDLPTLEAASTPAPADVRVVEIGPTEITVRLPLLTGGATAVLVATVDEGIVLSNPLTFVLP
jgi:hypothetical protein